MVNEKRPSRGKKSPHRSPKLLPGPARLVSRPLNIIRSDSNRERSEYSTGGEDIRPEDDSDIDEEGFSRTELAMAMAGDLIFEHESAIHSTLADGLSGTKHTGSEQNIPNHLLSSRWITPPTSPTFSLSPLVPVSPKFDAQRINYLKRSLKNLDVAKLMDYDKKFHNLMWDLKGITEWWTANRKEWIKNRDKLHVSQATLNSLVTQAKAAESSSSWDQHLRLKNACIEQRKQIKHNESWFPENKYLMKLVMMQFKRIQKQARNLDEIISHRVVGRKWVAPDGFSFGESPPDDFAIYKTQWWARQGFRWWLVMAAGHLKHCVEERTLQREPEQEAYDSVKDEIRQLKTSLALLKNDEQYDADYTRQVDDSMPKFEDPSSLDWKSQLRDLGHAEDPKALLERKNAVGMRAALKQLNLDRHELAFSVYRSNTLIERDSEILDLVRNVLKATEDNRDSLLLSSMDFSNGLYYICSLQGLGMQIMAEIEEIFTDDILQATDRLAIISSFELDVDAKESRGYNELLVKTLKNAIPFQSDLKDAKDSILYQLNVLNGTLDLAESLHYDRRIGRNLSRQTYPGRDLGRLKNPDQSIPLLVELINPKFLSQANGTKQASRWGQIKSLEHAKLILSRGNQDPNQDPGWWLRNFFVSPDIAPHFRRIEKITKDKFFELANSFLQEDFFVDETDAFLTWCTWVGDLFTVSGDLVSTYRQGWERIDEMPIDENCLRAAEFKKPPGLDDMKSWLIRNQDNFDLVGAGRDTTEAQMLSLIQRNYPRGESTFTWSKLRAILNWLDKSGLLYRYTSRKNRRGEIMIRRIDNGWGLIHKDKPYDAIFDLDKPEPYFQPLKSIIRREDVQTVLREANEAGPIGIEWSLYNVLQPYLQIKRVSGRPNTIITRHRFHLYLRWCDQIGDGIDFRRDGRVFGGSR
ncbi:uncharacterized protein RAG0_15425 [Rhynchosporium agropyri]|uniref:Uncharacterized protein n=1 Tax=Rhynchosporium agropyri TaxID=914238 RepID=A0A1E1LL36_9HELO|nr:uncharacterized protein RAG0_15425 [Rhynchosporium agropyri]